MSTDRKRDMQAAGAKDYIIQVNNLKTYFHTDEGIVRSVDDVSFRVERGKTLGIVGESGCGKSVTSLSVMGLVKCPPGRIEGGEILLDGENLLKKNDEEMRQIRGKRIAMIFQEPMTSLNPVFTVGQQITEALRIHEKISKTEARDRAIEMLRMVRIPLPEQRFKEYPHQLSGGMRQRVMIAMALCCKPDLLICDEPTTALDVTIQAQILNLINELKKTLGTSVMMITHDLGVIAEVADDVMVMYAGKVVEQATCDEIFDEPLHPYTSGLMNCIPRLNEDVEELSVIRGTVPPFDQMPKGCAFCPRCPYAAPICEEEMPPLAEYRGRQVRCFRYTDKWKPEYEKGAAHAGLESGKAGTVQAGLESGKPGAAQAGLESGKAGTVQAGLESGKPGAVPGAAQKPHGREA